MSSRARIELDRRAIGRGFDRRSAGYDAAAAIPREISRRMAERLDLVRLAPRRILDLGCGTGADLDALAMRYPSAQRVGCDLSPGMLRRAAARRPWYRRLAGRGSSLLAADALRLPFAGGSFGLVWSNLVLHWIDDLPGAFAEALRVLEVGGLLMFSAAGPDTLRELRNAFAAVDDTPHVHVFTDMHDVGDILVNAGFSEPVMDMEVLTLTYADLDSGLRELRAVSAGNVDAGRRRGLTGRARWQAMHAACERFRVEGRISASLEVVYGHAWKSAPRRSADGPAIVRIQRPAPRLR